MIHSLTKHQLPCACDFHDETCGRRRGRDGGYMSHAWTGMSLNFPAVALLLRSILALASPHRAIASHL